MKVVLLKAGLICIGGSLVLVFIFCLGMVTQKKQDNKRQAFIVDSMQNRQHFLMEAVQLTKNDIVVDYIDYMPGMGGTKEKPDTCLAYYQPEKKSIMVLPIHPEKY